jgi:Rrf2 family nitric oxide-sensitive transcriptional repressor
LSQAASRHGETDKLRIGELKLSLYADYALRVLMFAGLKGNEDLSTVSEIADHFDISRSHLTKVVHELGKLGYIETIQGKNGGFRLGKKPKQINIGMVVRKTEKDLAVIGCLQEANYCPIQPSCVLRRALNEATNAFLSVLDAYSLEDLLRPSHSLAKLLAIDAAHE